MKTVRIVQIYQNMDLRAGEYSLSDWLVDNTKHRKSFMNDGEVFLFLNRKRNIVKVMGKRGILTEKLPDKQTWDFKLRRNQLYQLIGKAFGINWSMSNSVYTDAKKEGQ